MEPGSCKRDEVPLLALNLLEILLVVRVRKLSEHGLAEVGLSFAPHVAQELLKVWVLAFRSARTLGRF